MTFKDFYQTIDNLTPEEFFSWFKQRTEEEWSNLPDPSLKDHENQQFMSAVSGAYPNTKWLGGLAELDIQNAEQTWNIQFPPDYRLFLNMLGAPDRHKFSTEYEGDILVQADRPLFYNWATDTGFLKQRFDRLLEDLLFDVEKNGVWYESWGQRPETIEDTQERVAELIHSAPKLIPIKDHRYLLETPLPSGNPVFSVRQSDIIVYGTDFRRFLIAEMYDLLNLNHNRAYAYALEKYDRQSVSAIPFWGDIITGEGLIGDA